MGPRKEKLRNKWLRKEKLRKEYKAKRRGCAKKRRSFAVRGNENRESVGEDVQRETTQIRRVQGIRNCAKKGLRKEKPRKEGPSKEKPRKAGAIKEELNKEGPRKEMILRERKMENKLRG